MSFKGDENESWTANPAYHWTIAPFASLLLEATAGYTRPPSSFEFVNASSVENVTDTNGNGSETRPEVWGDNVWAAFTILVCTLIIIGTVLGNTLICSAVAITRKLRTPSNILIVSLAVSDLLVGALDMPFALMYEVTGTWSIGEVMCDFWTSIDVLFCTASILNICVISIDRYLVITKPFQYAMKRTPVRMFLMIGLVWIVSAIISIPPLFGWKKPDHENECMVSQDKGYQFFATIGAFYLPLVIMVVIYSRIYLVSSRMNVANPRPAGGSSTAAHRTRPWCNGRTSNGNGHLHHVTPTDDPAMTSLFHLMPRDDGASDGLNGDGEPQRNGHLTPLAAGSMTFVTPLTSMTSGRDRSGTNSGSLVDVFQRLNCRQKIGRGACRGHERKATRTLGVIMGVFIACWLPFFILALIKPFCSDPANCIPQWLNSLLLWLGFTNSLLNPVIYARFNREFRMPFKYILQCRCANINSHLRSEEYTEQFGRIQVSHHSSLFPPPLVTPLRPPSSAAVTAGRRKSPFPHLPLHAPSPSSPSSLTPSSRQSLLFAPSAAPPAAPLTPTSQTDSMTSSSHPLTSPSEALNSGTARSRPPVGPGVLRKTSDQEPEFVDADDVSYDVDGFSRPSPPSPPAFGSHSSSEALGCSHSFESRSLLEEKRTELRL